MPIPFLIGAALAGAAGFAAKKVYDGNKEVISMATDQVFKVDTILTAKMSRMYDDIAERGENSEAYVLAQENLQIEGINLLEKVERVITAISVRNAVASGESQENHIIMAQAIAIMGNRDPFDADVKATIMKCIIGTMASDKGKTMLRGVAKNALNGIPGVGTAVGGFVDFSSTKLIGLALKNIFILGESAQVEQHLLLGMSGETEQIEACKQIAQQIETQYPKCNEFYYFHKMGKDIKKISKANKAYARVEDGETIVVVYDPTLFGSADEGISLSNQKVYYKREGEETIVLPYGDIKEISFEEQKEGKNTKYYIRIRTMDEKDLMWEAFLGDQAHASALCDIVGGIVEQARLVLGHEDVSSPPILELDEHAVAIESEEAHVVLAKQDASVQEQGLRCENCGHSLSPEAKFCMECGTPVVRKLLCVNCGKELEKEAKFCMECGTPVKK